MQLQDEDGNTLVTTPKVILADVANDQTSAVLYFMNTLGGIDTVVLQAVTQQLKTKSSSWVSRVGTPLLKPDSGTRRYDVTSQQLYSGLTYIYEEQDMNWLKELFSSSKVWLAMDAEQGQDADYLPVVITDATYDTQLTEGRYQYEVKVDFMLANDFMTQRN